MSECEGCGVPSHKFIQLLNGGLRLCQQCLAELNAQN